MWDILKISQLYQMCLFTAQHWKSNKLHLVPGCCGSTLNSKERSTKLTFNKVTLKSLGIVVHMFLRNIVSVLSFFVGEWFIIKLLLFSRTKLKMHMDRRGIARQQNAQLGWQLEQLKRQWGKVQLLIIAQMSAIWGAR